MNPNELYEAQERARRIALYRQHPEKMMGKLTIRDMRGKYGLFNKVVAPDRLMEEAMAWAKRLASGPTFALGMTKELLNGELSMDLWNALDNEARAQAVCMQTHDFREAYDAFSNKREPKFQGK